MTLNTEGVNTEFLSKSLGQKTERLLGRSTRLVLVVIGYGQQTKIQKER